VYNITDEMTKPAFVVQAISDLYRICGDFGEIELDGDVKDSEGSKQLMFAQKAVALKYKNLQNQLCVHTTPRMCLYSVCFNLMSCFKPSVQIG